VIRGATLTGIIINRVNFRDSDKIITVYTKTHGKLTGIAKGLRKSKSSRTGILELFNHVKLHLVPGRSQLPIITECQTIDSFPTWRKHLGKVTVGYELCEVIDKLTPLAHPHEQVYNFLLSWLSQLDSLGPNWRIQLDQWLVELVIELGFWPNHTPFTGDIGAFIDNLSESQLHTRRVRNKLSPKSSVI